MILKQYLNFIFVILLIDIFTPVSTYDNNQKWICKSKKFCQKEDQKVESSNITLFESQNDCRLFCGKYGAIWPMPTGKCTLGHERVHFDPLEIRFNVDVATKESSTFIDNFNKIFIENLLKECIYCTLTKSTNVQINIRVNSDSLVLDLKTDESYKLSIKTPEHETFIEIDAETIFGARHGLETLSNLVTGSMENDLLLVSSAFIEDSPKFAYRGLLLDTSRSFFSVHYIRKTLNAMAASKLNVFHWHVTDTHSFPLNIEKFPEMTRFGAYSSKQIYSRANIKDIVEYALLRGIRVLVEIDGPSHAGNGWQWGPEKGLGHLAVCVNEKKWQSYCIQPPCGQLNPLNDNMYRIMKEIYQYLAEVLQHDETIHMGGDEVHIPCWNKSEEITNAMIAQGYDRSNSSFYKLWSEFHRRNLEAYDDVMQDLNGHKTIAPKDVIIWNSKLTDPIRIEEYLPKERYIIQIWNGDKEEAKLREKGYRIIMSNKYFWYLDHGSRPYTSYHNWLKMYNYRINQSSSLMLGGEACMWSEVVNEQTFEARIWPRTGAVAERLWSDPSIDAKKVDLRFYRYRERLIARGCNTEVVLVPWCVLNEDQCYKT